MHLGDSDILCPTLFSIRNKRVFIGPHRLHEASEEASFRTDWLQEDMVAT